MAKPRIIAIVNQKGGVGKTTTTINLAAGLTLRGKKVLLIDLDPQGNAATGLGIPRTARDITVYDVLVDGTAIAEATMDTVVPGLKLVPSHIDLAGAELEIGDRAGRTTILRDALKNVDVDYVLIDCPPSLNLLTVNALSAARSVLVPLQCEFFALEGLSQLLQTVEMAKANINPKLVIDGVMLTMYDSRNRLSAQVAADVRKHLGRAVFKTVIPRNVRIAEAPSFGKPVTMYDPDCAGSKAYIALADEILARHARTRRK
ncbi:ParA family protein [Hellea sp.]|nr:ParA family protein [Hellea sp.]